MITIQLNDVHKNLLRDCLHDYVALWDVIKYIYPEISSKHPLPNWVLIKMLEIVREMLNSELFVAGILISKNRESEFLPLEVPISEFSPLTTPIDEIIKSIEKKWIRCKGESAEVGYSWWFQATPKGEQIARELGLIKKTK